MRENWFAQMESKIAAAQEHEFVLFNAWYQATGGNINEMFEEPYVPGHGVYRADYLAYEAAKLAREALEAELLAEQHHLDAMNPGA